MHDKPLFTAERAMNRFALVAARALRDVTLATLCAALVDAPLAHAGSITVSTAAELAVAVQNPANENMDIVLLPGRYLLKAPLYLLQGMNLRGPNTYVLDANGVPLPLPKFKNADVFTDPKSEAVIDGSRLPGDPGNRFGSPGVVIAGRSNELSGLTIVGNDAVHAAVEVANLSALGGARATVTGCILEGGRRGVRGYAFQSTFDGTASTLSIRGNVIRDNTDVFGFGIHVLHDQTQGAAWNVEVRSNRVYGNVAGLFTAILASQYSSIDVQSANNLYVRNVVGYEAIGGRDFPGAATVGNRTQLTSVGDTIANNGTEEGISGGVYAVGGQSDTEAFAQSVVNNHVDLQFFDTVFTTGQTPENSISDGTNLTRRDLSAFGAFARGVSTVGSGNMVFLRIRRATSDGTPGAFSVQDSSVPDPTGANRVVIRDSDVAITVLE